MHFDRSHGGKIDERSLGNAFGLSVDLNSVSAWKGTPRLRALEDV